MPRLVSEHCDEQRTRSLVAQLLAPKAGSGQQAQHKVARLPPLAPSLGCDRALDRPGSVRPRLAQPHSYDLILEVEVCQGHTRPLFRSGSGCELEESAESNEIDALGVQVAQSDSGSNAHVPRGVPRVVGEYIRLEDGESDRDLAGTAEIGQRPHGVGPVPAANAWICSLCQEGLAHSLAFLQFSNDCAAVVSDGYALGVGELIQWLAAPGAMEGRPLGPGLHRCAQRPARGVMTTDEMSDSSAEGLGHGAARSVTLKKGGLPFEERFEAFGARTAQTDGGRQRGGKRREQGGDRALVVVGRSIGEVSSCAQGLQGVCQLCG